MTGQFKRVEFEGVETSEQVIARVRETTDTVVLSFSCGKDSIAAWLAIRPHFKRIVPYCLSVIPGLEFEERSIRYYEEFFQTRIYRLPHLSWYRMMNNLAFCPPERCPVIDRLGLGEPDYDEMRNLVCQSAGIPERTFDAKGVRAADSLMRRTNFKMRGGINWNARSFFPVWDWRKDELVAKIKEAGVRMPVDYALFGRSFDGIDFRFLYPIKKHFPDDYRRILEHFPLAELEIKRFEYAQRHKAQK